MIFYDSSRERASLSANEAENQQIAELTPNFTFQGVKLGVLFLSDYSKLHTWSIV
jgi:hypothetical protein